MVTINLEFECGMYSLKTVYSSTFQVIVKSLNKATMKAL